MSFFYPDEKDIKKIFFLGLTAPSFFFALTNGQLYTDSNKNYQTLKEQYAILVQENNKLKEEIRGTGGHVSLYSAYNLVQFTLAQDIIKTYSIPQESPAQQFIRGITGGASGNTWFVVVGSYAQKEAALQHAGRINRGEKGFHAWVYAPYKNYPYYDVAIGEYLTLEAALALKEKAIQCGFPTGTFIKSLPGK